MYRSNFGIDKFSKGHLISLLKNFLKKNQKVYCRALQKKISLAKLPEAIVERKQDSKKRLQCFFVAIEILKKSSDYKTTSIKGEKCFEVRVLSREGNMVFLHLREEIKRKDKVTYLVSTFYK